MFIELNASRVRGNSSIAVIENILQIIIVAVTCYFIFHITAPVTLSNS
jgi:hypothetical protein